MKILIVTHDANFSGGANRSLFGNIEKMIENGDTIVVLLPSKKGELNEKLKEIGIKCIYAKYWGVISGLRHDGKDFLRRIKVIIGYYLEKIQARRVVKRIKESDFDLVYTNTRLPMIGANIAKELNIPHVIHVREFGTVEPLWGKWDYSRLYEDSAKIILISDALKNKFTEFVPDDKLIVSRNGILYPTFLYKPKKLKSTVNIVITGRLVPDKGQVEAIYALHELKTNPNIQKNIILHIVGSSPKRTHVEWYRKSLINLVKKLNLENNVIFEGEISDICEFRKNMDIELMCSICETFGRVTVEAMRSNLLVIGSNTGGTTEIIIDKKTGLLYKQGDYKDLALKIIEVLDNNQLYNTIRYNANKFADRNFLVGSNYKEINDVFQSVAGQKKC